LKNIPHIGIRSQAFLSMVIVTIIFGLHYSIAKSLMPAYYHPLQLVFFRLLCGFILFWLFQKLFVHEKIVRKDLFKLAICGFFGLSMNVTLFYIGLHLTTPVDASIIHVTNPLLVLVLSGLLIGEKITGRKVTGIVLGITGALILILYGKGFRLVGQTTIGNILILLNMVSYALYLVLVKPLVSRYHIATILKWVSFFGFLFVVPITFPFVFLTPYHSQDVYSWFGIGYVIVLNTFVAYMLINFSLMHISPTTVSYFTYFQPVLAAISSVSAGMERITLSKVIAALLIFSGVYIVTRGTKRRRPSEEVAEG
jgi:drug/metabolite transporter (DMT)-like permease